MIPLANRHVKDANLQLNRIDIIQELPVNTRLYDIVQELSVHTGFQNEFFGTGVYTLLVVALAGYNEEIRTSEIYCPRDHLITYD